MFSKGIFLMVGLGIYGQGPKLLCNDACKMLLECYSFRKECIAIATAKYFFYSCISSRYMLPIGSVRIDFETLPNDHLVAMEKPPGLEDTEIELVRLNDTLVCIHCGRYKIKA